MANEKMVPPAIDGPRDIARELGGWIEHSHAEHAVHVAIPVHVAEYLYGILLGVASRQVSSAVPSEEAAALGCRDSAVQRSGAVPGDKSWPADDDPKKTAAGMSAFYRPETSPVALAHSAFKAPPAMTDAPCFAVPGDTPLVHSTLLEMIGFAATGRCMACGWPVKASADEGCVQGNCSFRPDEHYRNPENAHIAVRWRQRTQILTLARKYLNGELGKDAAAETRS